MKMKNPKLYDKTVLSTLIHVVYLQDGLNFLPRRLSQLVCSGPINLIPRLTNPILV